MSTDPLAPTLRERAVLTVFDHSGPTPRAVEEIEVLSVGDRVISRARRRLSALEASRAQAERGGRGLVSEFVREDWRRTIEDLKALGQRFVPARGG